MSSKRTLSLALVCLVLLGVLAYHLLPKHYEVMERRQSTIVLWKGDDVLILIRRSSLGRSENVLQRKLRGVQKRAEYALLMLLMNSVEPLGEEQSALLIRGRDIHTISLPSDFRADRWKVLSGHLVTTAFAGTGWKWNGVDFVPLTGAEQQALTTAEIAEHSAPSVVKADDEETQEDLEGAPFAQIKAAGWHYKQLFAFDSTRAIVLPITTNSGKLILTQQAVPPRETSTDPFEQFGRSGDLVLEGDPLRAKKIIASGSKGEWKEIGKAEYQEKRSHFGRSRQFASPFPIAVWIILLVAGLARFSFVIDLLRIFGLKKRLATNIASSYSIPPAVPEQFPALDRSALQKYTDELEHLGFTRLGDFSLVPSGKALQIPVFLRLFTHARHQCFAEIGQVFPRGQSAQKFGCAIMSGMEDEWKITVSDRKPQAAGVFIRLPRSLSRSFPGLSLGELVRSFLEFRSQVALDLGIKSLPNATLEEYVVQQQKSAIERQKAVKNRSVTLGLARYYKRLLTFGRPKPMYEWLGEYPRIAAQRNASWTPTLGVGVTR